MPVLQNIQNSVSGEILTEMEARVQLAACYRLLAHFRMTETIYNHVSLRLPGYEDRFLINAFGLLYEEITASNLVTIDIDGNVIDDPTGLGVNRAGFVIHSAVHKARHDVACVLHTHSAAGIGVSAQASGLLPISQHAAFFHGALSYHDSEGVAVSVGERERLVVNLGDNYAMILRNHGLLTAGRTVGEALQLMLNLERACQAQIAALAGGTELLTCSTQALEDTAEVGRTLVDYGRDWAALLRLADRVAPDHRN